ncbi:11714_t:CDS:2 [Entrophospora sp. SA101]|nr:11714_t:CDS:2 [Entrophospora sp. SA101]
MARNNFYKNNRKITHTSSSSSSNDQANNHSVSNSSSQTTENPRSDGSRRQNRHYGNHSPGNKNKKTTHNNKSTNKISTGDSSSSNSTSTSLHNDSIPASNEEKLDDNTRQITIIEPPIVLDDNNNIDPKGKKPIRYNIEASTSKYECMICCESIKYYDKTWFCRVCWAVFHINCIQKWAGKSITEKKDLEMAYWRCPGCQNQLNTIPDKYLCFCGKMENPPNKRCFTPHSCGQKCGRKREKVECPHTCTSLCHPGPCPVCPAMGPVQYCYCGREKYQFRCSDPNYSSVKSCGKTCGRLLECGKHYCERPCHEGDCRCEIIEKQKCYCGQSVREAKCEEGNATTCYEKTNSKDDSWIGYFSCEKICNKLYDCEFHSCTKKCHPIGEVEPCPFNPSRLKSCPCGSRTIKELLGRERTSCKDEIPLCTQICGKLLECGHKCQSTCHHGDCKCDVHILVKCRCGSTEFDRICSEVSGKNDIQELLCDKMCQGLKSCGKHQCNVKCCPAASKQNLKGKTPESFQDEYDHEEIHKCKFICGKKLRCGNHNCELNCHKGHCMQCLEASFEELTCSCGNTKLYPPIPCGKKLPACQHQCNRTQSCGHNSVPHLCHEDGNCPPCPFLVSKLCSCGKRVVNNVPCHQRNVSCGKACDLILECGGHRCKRICHQDNCLSNGVTPGKCSQPCGKPRKSCGHKCDATCHAPARCPDNIPCKAKITIKCKCGNLSHETTCNTTTENAEEMKNRRLNCNDHCAVVERNRKLASALELDDRVGDGNAPKLVPEYEEDLLSYYSSNKEWAKNIESMLNNFILKSEKKLLNMPAMKKLHRKFIHNLCVHYRLASDSMDVEPYRSVVVTKKIDSLVPSVLLSQAYTNNYKSTNQSQAVSSPSSSTAQQPVRKNKQAINAIYLSELEFGITHEKLCKDLEPLLKKTKFQLKWVTEKNDAMILPSAGSMHADEFETFLAKIKLLIKDTLVTKGIAESAELCWVNSKYEITWQENKKSTVSGIGNKPSNVIEVDLQNQSTIPPFIYTNPFDTLAKQPFDGNVKSGETSKAKNPSDTYNSKQQISDQKDNESKSIILNNDDIVDNWELLSDN